MILLCVMALFSFAGFHLAKEKNRDKWGWAISCFLIPILFFMLVCLRDLESNNKPQKD